MSGNWIDIGAIEDIPLLGARVVRGQDIDIAVFRTADDRVFALEDKCPHKGGPLSQGIVHDCRVTCPLHNLVLDLESGKPVGPDEGQARTVPVKIESGRLFLSLPDRAGSNEASLADPV